MRGPFLILIIITLGIAATYWYQSSAALCPVPLSYSIGELDPSFNVSYEKAREYAAQAESVWEDEIDRVLFVYDEEAEFKINYLFDDRQETANSEERQRFELDDKKIENDKIMNTVEGLQADYESLKSSYESEVASYDQKLEEYNQEVNKYNDRGGAPADVFEKLEETRVDLNNESESLNKTANELNKLALEVNELSDRGNKLVEEYNREVHRYNEEFGFTREFTQGDYQGDEINIYKFSSENELVAVLAHELGHALGIGHVEDDSSLMYYLIEDVESQPSLTPDDLAAYYDVCNTEETFGQSVRRIIRNL